MPKKTKDNLKKIKWTTPPFSRVIKLSDLNVKKNNQFIINLLKKETKSLVKKVPLPSPREFPE